MDPMVQHPMVRVQNLILAAEPLWPAGSAFNLRLPATREFDPGTVPHVYDAV
jgi:hypothetical protein